MQEQREENPIVTIVMGLLMIAGAVWLYTYFSGFEERGGSMRMNVILLALYKLGGKWLACGLVAAVGIAVTVVGIRKKLAG